MDKYVLSVDISLSLRKVYNNLVTARHNDGSKLTILEAIDKTLADDFDAKLGSTIDSKKYIEIVLAFIEYLKKNNPDSLLKIQM